MRSPLVAVVGAALALSGGRAGADPACRREVQVQVAPVANAQMAVWIEDARGHVVDTIYVTRSTGALGLGNRPGNPRLKSDYRFPYGAREMVLPVWAHARGKAYPRVVMGGSASADPSNNDNDTIGFHFPISSPEPFYCSPNGGLARTVAGVDVLTCASPFYGAKGRYGAGTSLYPPRADLTAFSDHDSPDARDFAAQNDLATVSGATPRIDGALRPLDWFAPNALPDGSYSARVELSREGDFNAGWVACSDSDAGCVHPSRSDVHPELRSYGRNVLGQPSLVWSVPFVLDREPRVASTAFYEGYGEWDGSSGALHPPDATISEAVDGSGARRLLVRSDGDGSWQVKVLTSGCGAALCDPPEPPSALQLEPSDSGIEVRFRSPEGSIRPERYEVRYRVGDDLTDENFARSIPGDGAPEPGPPDATQALRLDGFKADSAVSVGVRAVAACGDASRAAIARTRTLPPQFTTLHGCFVATAAWGSPMAREVDALRRFRDRSLLDGNPAGAVSVAVYYALGPSLAAAIAGDARLRQAARAVLAPLVSAIGAGGDPPR